MDIPPAIEVICDSGAASGAYLEGGYLVMTEHQISNPCRALNRLLKFEYRDKDDDIAISRVDLRRKGLKFSCEPLVAGQEYTLVSRDGRRTATATDRYVHTTNTQTFHMRVVSGLSMHGHSGGPVVDSDGFARGVVSGRNVEMGMTFIKEFADTPLCE